MRLFPAAARFHKEIISTKFNALEVAHRRFPYLFDFEAVSNVVVNIGYRSLFLTLSQFFRHSIPRYFDCVANARINTDYLSLRLKNG